MGGRDPGRGCRGVGAAAAGDSAAARVGARSRVTSRPARRAVVSFPAGSPLPPRGPCRPPLGSARPQSVPAPDTESRSASLTRAAATRSSAISTASARAIATTRASLPTPVVLRCRARPREDSSSARGSTGSAWKPMPARAASGSKRPCVTTVTWCPACARPRPRPVKGATSPREPAVMIATRTTDSMAPCPPSRANEPFTPAGSPLSQPLTSPSGNSSFGAHGVRIVDPRSIFRPVRCPPPEGAACTPRR